jgi:sugar lactone lactonase YvrE
MTNALEVFVAAPAALGESPVWDARSGSLHWVDILTGRWLRCDADGTSVEETVLGTYASFIARTDDQNRFLVGVDGDVRSVARDGSAHSVADICATEHPGIRMNDGQIGPDGALYVGVMDTEARRGRGSMVRVEASGAHRTVLTGLTVPNGLAWESDHSLLHIDSVERRVDRLTFDPSGYLVGRDTAFRTDAYQGVPDGMAMDAEGNLWIAFWEGSAVRAFTPFGQLISTWQAPVSRVTSCAFGGAGLDRLFVTSAQGPAAGGDEGAVLAAEVGVIGLATREWRGTGVNA